MLDLIFLLVCLSSIFGFMALDRWHDKRMIQTRLKYQAQWEQDIKKIEHEFQEKRNARTMRFVEENLDITPFPVYILLRQDDNGSRSIVKCFFDKEDAEKVLGEYNELSHKQLYWLKVDKKRAVKC